LNILREFYLSAETAFRVVSTSWEARDYIEGRGKYRDRTCNCLPDLLVSDFQLTGATRTEFVKWLREQAFLPKRWSSSGPGKMQ